MRIQTIRRRVAAAALVIAGFAGVMGAATAHAANSDGSPSLHSRRFQADRGDDFNINGSGYTPRRVLNVWLIDQSADKILWFSNKVTADGYGNFSVNGPITYHPADNVWAAYSEPGVSLPCGHHIIARAKDGDYNNPAARWDTGPGPQPGLSETDLFKACPRIY